MARQWRLEWTCLDPGQVLAHEGDWLRILEAVADHERPRADAEPEDKAIVEEFANRARRRSSRHRFALPHVHDRGADYDLFGRAQQMRRHHERVATKGLRHPQHRITELLD